MKEKKVIRHPAGELIDFETVFIENPEIEGVPQRTGRFERLDYTTDVYEDGKTYPKYCYVYLPWGYDPEDKEKRYNVLYYQHGNTCEPELFVGEYQSRFDKLFEAQEIEPCLIVCTTYYFDLEKDRDERKKTGSVPAGDGQWKGIKGNFYLEVIRNIIPAVELKYNTYLTSGSDASIRATRDHRAFSGYSRGSGTTWCMFHHILPYFRWFAPMSCHCTAGKIVFDPLTMEEVIDYLQEPVRKNPELPFFIFATNGGPEDVQKMNEQMKVITKLPEFSYGKDPRVNNIYYSVSDFPHTDLLVPYYYFNSLQTLFKA